MAASTFDHDVVIIGSGPAGCSTALHLAGRVPSSIPRLLIVERDRHPRQKLCAGGLVPDVGYSLERLGLDLREVPSVDAKWLHLLYEGRGSRLRLYEDRAFPVVRRHELDAWLADKVRAAGVRLQEETAVRSVRRVDGGVEIVTSRGVLRARAVVGADGSSSVVRRAVRAPTGSGIGRAIEVLTPADSPHPTGPGLPIDEASMEFGGVPGGFQGYAWCFPAREKGAACRTFGTYDSRVSGGPPSGSLKDVLDREMASHGYRLSDYPVEGHPIRWFQAGAPLSAPHVLLAGDAAGVDPFFGEGIGPALGYGELAATALEDALARRDFSFAGYTRDVGRSPLGRSLARRRIVAEVIYRLRAPALQALLWRHGERVIDLLCRRVIFNWARPRAA